MSKIEKLNLILELEVLTRTNILRTDEESRQAYDRIQEICKLFGVEYADDVLENPNRYDMRTYSIYDTRLMPPL